MIVYLSDIPVPLAVTDIDGTWNGFAVPVVTADQFREIVAVLQAHDQASALRDAAKVVESDALYLLGDDEPERWKAVGVDAMGSPVYRIDGWQFGTHNPAEDR